MDRRDELQARKEALMREVNERLRAVDSEAGWADPDQRFAFQCECGNPDGCEGRVEMTLAEYERVRAQQDRFVVVPGHEDDAIEHVVERDERYYIVDKADAVERLVE